MPDTKLTTSFLKEKQKIKIKHFIVPSIIFSLCFIFWLVLAFSGIPKVGRIITFFVFVIVPIALFTYLIKLKTDELKHNFKLLDNGCCISKMYLKKKDFDTDDLDTTTYSLILFSKNDGEDACRFTHSVSRKYYKSAVVGGMYYAVFIQQEDEYGKRYFLEDIYSAHKYELSDELLEFLIDYEEISKTNSMYASNYWVNKK